MKKVLIIIIVIMAILLILAGIVGISGYNYYKECISPTGSEDEKVTLVINEGLTSKEIIDVIYDANLTKNKKAAYLYLKLHKDVNMQAGTYNLNRGMSLEEIIKKISSGEAEHETIQITFVEGKKLTYFAEEIHKKYPEYSEEQIMNQLQDKEYLKELIAKYWFLTDEILNDKLYYALEGYLHPNTYLFAKDASIKDIIKVLLDNTEILLNKYKSAIESSDYTVHEIITMASIVELEGAHADRNGVAGVFYNRLAIGEPLGSDVTTYYAERIEMSDRDLYQAEIEEANDYNTRSYHLAGKLPVGPICNPSENSINAALNPTDHEYLFFVADKYGKTYFSKDSAEHENTIARLKSEGLWHEYE